MQVIGAGYGRTGTLSLHAALVRLGFAPCHHMSELLLNLDQIPLWREALATEPLDLHRPLEGYRSAVDFPICGLWREALEAWPDAKVILTVRDPHRWYESAHKTIFAFQNRPLPPDADADAVEVHQFMTAELMPRLLDLGDGRRLDQVGEDEAVEAFNRHNDEVRRDVPADQLLVYQVSQGWEPLCAFLGVPAPEEEFPHLNESAAFGETAMRIHEERARRRAARQG